MSSAEISTKHAVCSLTLRSLVKFLTNGILKYFSSYNLHEMSNLFSCKIRKNISKSHLFKFLPGMLNINNSEYRFYHMVFHVMFNFMLAQGLGEELAPCQKCSFSSRIPWVQTLLGS